MLSQSQLETLDVQVCGFGHERYLASAESPTTDASGHIIKVDTLVQAEWKEHDEMCTLQQLRTDAATWLDHPVPHQTVGWRLYP